MVYSSKKRRFLRASRFGISPGGGGGWGGGDGGAASWGGDAVDGGSVNAFLDADLTRAMRVTVTIPSVASASVLHSAAFGESVVGVVGPL